MRATLPFFLLFLVSWCAAGQDILVKRNGDEINAKVLTITPQEVTYRLAANPPDSAAAPGPEQTIARRDVFMIKYANGAKEVFEAGPADDEKIVPSVPVSNDAPPRRDRVAMLQRGKVDAVSFYQGYKGAATGTLITSLVMPLAGLIPAVACSATPPKDHNLQYPSHELFNDNSYQHGYRQQARRIKVGRVWRNWGIGLGVNLAVAILLAR